MKIIKITKEDSKYIWTKCGECEGVQKECYFELHTKTLSPAITLCDECFDTLKTISHKTIDRNESEYYI